MLISYKELKYLNLFLGRQVELEIPTDLGKSKRKVKIDGDFLIIDEKKVNINIKIVDNTVYYIDNNELKPVEIFSQKTNRLYKLVPTKDWPTVTISSTPMHKVSFSSPKQDTKAKLRALGEIKGKALDTCMGAGYTATLLSKKCDVDVFEIDKNMIDIAKFNPYSKELFEDKIKVNNKDIFEEIKKIKDNTYDVIIHDPPTFKYAPMLYSSEFYTELKRVLKPHGKLYHYTPRPNVKSGRDFPKEVEKRLEKFFINIEFHEDAQGFTTQNP